VGIVPWADGQWHMGAFNMKEPSERRRRGPDLWLEAAYDLLAQHGHGAVTIEQLTAQTAKTRGSFYHHFGSMEAFVERLMVDWRERNTERIVRLTEGTSEPNARRSLVNQEALRLDARLEIALRIWAGVHAYVRAACDDVDRRRVSVMAHDLADLAKALGCDLSEPKARTLAQIEYAAFVGAQLLAPEGKSTALTELGQVYDDMLTAYLTHLRAVSGAPLRHSV
jgi:AcrR family transcriptional regulator